MDGQKIIVGTHKSLIKGANLVDKISKEQQRTNYTNERVE
jgi:hypothetical protein